MNQKNVALLLAILDKELDRDTTNHELADLLAKRGVLVPSALTDQEAKEVIRLCGCSEGDMSGVAHEKVGPTLERIAKGEDG